MMERSASFLCLFLLLIATPGLVRGQNCEPDPAVTTAGFHPDTSEGFDDAIVGQSYEQLVTVKFPTDTTIQGFSVTIDSASLDSIKGLPPGFYFLCEPQDSMYPSGVKNCFKIFGNPSTGDEGNYPLTFHVMGYIQGGTKSFTYDGYEILVKQPVGVQEYRSSPDKIGKNRPNPFSERTIIEHSLGSDLRKEDLRVINVLGEEVSPGQYELKITEEEVIFSPGDMKPGIYLYSLKDHGITRRMILR